jgi:hypothetical protein
MPNEIQDTPSAQPSVEQSSLKSLFQEVTNDFKSLVNGQSKSSDAASASSANLINEKFGTLTLTDDGAAKPDQSIARAAKPGEQPESLKEAQIALVNKDSSQEDKLRAANQMAKEGQTTFTGPDGRRYDISAQDVNGQTSVSVHTNDGKGNSHPVLRGYVDKDGHVLKQADTNHKALSYEGTWASHNLKDSPLIGSKEKSEVVAESPESLQLKKTMADQGIAPVDQTQADRITLAKEHSQLQGQVDQEQARLKAVKAEADEKNKPIQQQEQRLSEANDKIYDKMDPIRKDAFDRNQKLAAELKDKGIGDGSKIDFDNKESVQKIKNDVDADKSIDDAGKKRIKDELNALDKKSDDLKKMNAVADHNVETIDKLDNKISDNLAPVAAEGHKLNDARKALRENENKLAESKFSDDLKTIDKLPKDQRDAIYNSLEQITRDGGGAPNNLSADQRKQLVEETAHQIANPEAIKQGNKGTCGLASTEMELAKSHPDKYAQYVADLATKGVAKTPDGRDLHVQADLINVTDKKGNLVPQDDGNPVRSLSSKIFQSAAANRILEDRAQSANPPESPATYDTQRPGSKYPIEMGEINANGKGDVTSPDDTGERIVHKDGKVEHWDGVDAGEISKLTSELTGQKYEAQSIINGRDMSKPAQEAAAEKDFIAAAEKTGLPMKVNLTVLKGDFTGMNNEGGHEVVVTRIEPGTPSMVYYENTAGGTDHSYPTGRPVPLKSFLTAMQQTRMASGVVHDQGYVITRVN